DFSVSNSHKSKLRRQMMSAQKSNQLATSQSGSGEEQKNQQEGQRNQQGGLMRRSAVPSVPALLLDPLGFFGDDDSFSLIRRMQREMNRVFSQAGLNASDRGDDFLRSVWSPTTEIAFRNGNLEVSAELPGLTE